MPPLLSEEFIWDYTAAGNNNKAPASALISPRNVDVRTATSRAKDWARFTKASVVRGAFATSAIPLPSPRREVPEVRGIGGAKISLFPLVGRWWAFGADLS